jgi:hypothetical protein
LGKGARLNDLNVTSSFVSGETKEPEKLYQALENGEFQCLVNCMKCTEGFDCPPIECVVLARPTQSVNLYRQCVGRGTRTSPETGKKDCLVLDFAYITGDLPLVGAASLLREKLTDVEEEDADAIFAAAEEILASDSEADLFQVLEEAKKTVEEQKEAERIRQEIEAREAARREERRLKNKEERFRYEVTTIDPLTGNLIGITPLQMDKWGNGEPITDPQASLITKLSKGKIPVEGLSKRAASGIIGQLMADKEKGLCTYGQRDLMVKKLGVSPEIAREMKFEEAKAYISQHKTW